MNPVKIRVKKNCMHYSVSRYLPTLGACLLSSLLVSCASVEKNGPAVAETQAVPVAEQKAASTVKKSVPVVKEEMKSAGADALMATLAAPVVEPGSKSEPVVEVKPEPIKKIVEVPVKPKAEMKPVVIEAKPKVKAVVKSVEKPVVAKKIVKTAVPAVSPDKPKKMKSTGTAKPLNITSRDLPASYDIWTLKQGETTLTQGLVIMTPTWEMGKEGYMSQIWLTLMEDKIHINSSSDIATESGKLGIKIDGGELIPFSHIAENSIGVLEGEWLDKLAKANKMDIYLGFFPGKKPTSERFKSDTNLDNLDRVVMTYRKLQK